MLEVGRRKEKRNSILSQIFSKCWYCSVFHVFNQLTGAPDNRGTDFIIGFMENYIMGSYVQCELFVTTARTTVVSVKVDSPKCTSPKISASFSITAGSVKQLIFDYRIRVVGSRKESKGISLSLSPSIHLLSIIRLKCYKAMIVQVFCV